MEHAKSTDFESMRYGFWLLGKRGKYCKNCKNIGCGEGCPFYLKRVLNKELL